MHRVLEADSDPYGWAVKRGLLPNKKASRVDLVERVRANLREPAREG